jgi:hypothetical protein
MSAKMFRPSGNRAQRRAEVIHRRKLFDGQMTAEEAHQQFALPPGAKCLGCNARPMTTFRTFIELSELRKQDELFVLMETLDRARLHSMTVFFKDSSGNPVPYVKMNTVYACKSCTPAAEKMAAKGPSWYVVEIDRGPGADKIVSRANPMAELAVERAVANMSKGD